MSRSTHSQALQEKQLFCEPKQHRELYSPTAPAATADASQTSRDAAKTWPAKYAGRVVTSACVEMLHKVSKLTRRSHARKMPFCSGLRPLRSSLRRLSQELPAAISVALDRLLLDSPDHSRSWLPAPWAPQPLECTMHPPERSLRGSLALDLGGPLIVKLPRRSPNPGYSQAPRAPSQVSRLLPEATGPRRLASRATHAHRTFNCFRLHMTGQQLTMTSLVCQRGCPAKLFNIPSECWEAILGHLKSSLLELKNPTSPNRRRDAEASKQLTKTSFVSMMCALAFAARGHALTHLLSSEDSGALRGFSEAQVGRSEKPQKASKTSSSNLRAAACFSEGVPRKLSY